MSVQARNLVISAVAQGLSEELKLIEPRRISVPELHLSDGWYSRCDHLVARQTCSVLAKRANLGTSREEDKGNHQ